jgi:hypothetical protein
MMLGCFDHSTGSQFVQIDRTSVLATRAPDLRLRVLDRTGRLLGERDQLFPPGAGFWGQEHSLVLGNSGFAHAYGFLPDAQLPAEMDSAGGTVQLVRAEGGADRVLSELHYGPGGVANPPPGSALVLDHGTWGPDSLPHPRGFSGNGELSPTCRSSCEQQQVQLSLGTPLIVPPTAANYSDSYSDVQYSLSRAAFDVSSRFKHAELLMSDRYSVAGATAPETLETIVDVAEAHEEHCERNACVRSSRRLHVIVDGELVDSLLADVHESGQLTVRVPFQPHQTTRIQLFASADGSLFPDLPGRVAGRLTFAPVRAGERLVSCGGFDSELARVVRGATWSAEPRSVEITWSLNTDPGFTADVQRLDESDPQSTWVRRDTRPVEASGALRFRDQKVSAGTTYRYRLAWSDAFGSYTSDETRVSVPRPFAFALLGARPNPSHGTLSVGFELAQPSAVQLELFDLLGRRVREIHAAFATGVQQVALDQGRKLGPGLYQARLRAGDQVAKLTVVVLP